MPRIAIVDKEKCKPTKCSKECIKRCPPQRSGKKVIEIIDIEDIGFSKSIDSSKTIVSIVQNMEIDKNKIAKIVESQCIGCGQCIPACPFSAIKIVNVPEENPLDIVHRYGPNAFRLYKLPLMKKNSVIGLVGQNGIGKTTLVDILSNKFLPNFEQFIKPPTAQEIITRFRGSVMQTYLKDLYGNKLVFSIKEQKIKQMIKGKQNFTVREYVYEQLSIGSITGSTELNSDQLAKLDVLSLTNLLENKLSTLSGGELQRLLICVTCLKPANVYIFDEPSNFLDVKQRLEVAKLIRSVSNTNTYVLVIEHDLSLMDYIADDIHILFGVPSAYGIVSNALTVSNGINEYLEGYIKTQNIRFRDEAFNLKQQNEIQLSELGTENASIIQRQLPNTISYDDTIITYPNFTLKIPSGIISLSNNINVILGENGTGKTTFINYLASHTDMSCRSTPEHTWGISYKDQHTNIRKFFNKTTNLYPTVLELFFHSATKKAYLDPVFQSDVISTLGIKQLEVRTLDELSGGELQRVMITYCLATPANIYLLDEPSSNLDIENRLAVTKAIKKFASSFDKCIFLIEHDIMMSVSIAQEFGSKILFVKKNITNNNENTLSKQTVSTVSTVSTISAPLDFLTGINYFLSEMGITMRIAGHNRPRINKYGSQMDQEQKRNGTYYG
jgi:ATP-binding cassette subfamily E protein 1